LEALFAFRRLEENQRKRIEKRPFPNVKVRYSLEQ